MFDSNAAEAGRHKFDVYFQLRRELQSFTTDLADHRNVHDQDRSEWRQHGQRKCQRDEPLVNSGRGEET